MKNVVIYSTPTCHFCHLAKDFFKDNNVQYEEFDLTVHPEKAREVQEMTGQIAVPVIKVDDEVVVGFQQAHLEDLLGLSGTAAA